MRGASGGWDGAVGNGIGQLADAGDSLGPEDIELVYLASPAFQLDAEHRRLLAVTGRRGREGQRLRSRPRRTIRSAWVSGCSATSATCSRTPTTCRLRSLLRRLHDLEEAPWGEWYGKPLTARGLAKLLEPYR